MEHGSSQLGARILILLGVVWAIIVVIGLFVLFQYQTTPGVIGNPATRRPTDSRIGAGDGRALLVMAAHPQCPCTRASIEALARIMAHSQHRAMATVLFLKPKGVPSGWERTDLWHSAAAIPGVQVVSDEDGTEAARFGAESSGHVLLYDRNGRRLFSGGITAGRGHHGDNAGLDQCIGLVNGQTTDQRDTPVFGCSLIDPSVEAEKGTGLCRKTN